MTICDLCGKDIDDYTDHARVTLPPDPPSAEEVAAAVSGARVRPGIGQLDVCRACITPMRDAAEARRKADN